jgi:hypothetical protein
VQPHSNRLKSFLLGALLLAASFARAADATAVVWKLDDVSKIGGHATELIGAPRVVDGAAVFDGAKDGVLIPVNPLAGAKAFTIEILFNPAEGGLTEQRFLHLEDSAASRVMIETRLDGKGGWWLDTFLSFQGKGLPLIDPKRVHPTGKWHWAALRYDGKTMSHFINGEKELEGEVAFGPMVAGKISLGVRQNKVFWFKGAIREVRFTPAALAPEKLQRVR